MISYDDIVKAGSNIGGWEGKRGFYAVELYYEMAEKLRVQGYEKLQAGDNAQVRRAPQLPSSLCERRRPEP